MMRIPHGHANGKKTMMTNESDDLIAHVIGHQKIHVGIRQNGKQVLVIHLVMGIKTTASALAPGRVRRIGKDGAIIDLRHRFQHLQTIGFAENHAISPNLDLA